jgi:hypothetical protein
MSIPTNTSNPPEHSWVQRVLRTIIGQNSRELRKAKNTLNQSEPTWVQRFLWSVAGAEISILEECRTDHKKFSAIGTTILMTTLIAFFAGSSAAWYFSIEGENGTGNVWAAIVFGILWALLIFSIDRSLVITLKKDPTLAKQKFWVPLLSRAALACLIALMISIPLELYIFKGFISSESKRFNVQMEKSFMFDTVEDSLLNTSSQNLKNNNTYSAPLNNRELALTTEILNIETELSLLEAKKKQIPDSYQGYGIALMQYNQYKTILDNSKNKIIGQDIANEDSIREMMNKEKGIVNSANKNWADDIENQIIAKGLRSKKREQVAKRDSVQKTIDKLTDIQITINSDINKLNNSMKTKTTDYSIELKKSNRFINNFRVLEWAVWRKNDSGGLSNPTELIFLWLIRLLFFIVEILPTVVKIATPIGTYDWRVHQEEKDLITYLSSTDHQTHKQRINALKTNAKENAVEHQNDAEKTLREDLIKKVSDAQKEVTEAYLNDWKERELKNLELKNKIFI